MKIVEILEKIVEMYKSVKKNFFLFCMCKMVKITKEKWRKNRVEVIIFKGKKWLKETNIKDQLKQSKLSAATLQYSSEFRKKMAKITRL